MIQGKFGTGSQEYIGVLAIYLCGSVIGTLWFSVLGSIAPSRGCIPWPWPPVPAWDPAPC